MTTVEDIQDGLGDGRVPVRKEASNCQDALSIYCLEDGDVLGIAQDDEVGIVRRQDDLSDSLIANQDWRNTLRDVPIVEVVFRLIDHQRTIFQLEENRKDRGASLTRGKLVDGTELLARLPAVTTWIAGRMLQQASLPQQLAHELDNVVLRRLASIELAERNAALEAATGLLHLRRTFDDALKRLAGTHDQDALGYIAVALARERDALRAANLFFEWLAPCKYLGQSYKGALGQLDFALSTLLVETPEERDATLAFLLDWIEAQPFGGPNDRRFAELFGMSASAILNSPPLLSRVVTQWLLADSMAPAAAIGGLLSGMRHNERTDIRFDGQLLDGVPDSDLIYLARRLLGYIIYAEQLLSLALSLLSLPHAPRRVFPMMRSLLGDEIGYDYPGTTIQRLQDAEPAADPDARALLAEIRGRIEADMARLEGLPRLKELEPPPALRRAFRKERAKQMARAMDDAQSESILQQLATTVHLKGGDRSFQYLTGVQRYTDPMVLQSMSVSVEMPRREALDPVGNAYRMHINRSVKRGGT